MANPAGTSFQFQFLLFSILLLNFNKLYVIPFANKK